MPDNATPAAGTDIATRSSHPLVQFKHYVEQRATELIAALPAHISPDKFQRTLMTAVQENPDLLQCDRRSLWLACLKCGHDGLLPDKREAVILPFKENKKVDGGWQTKYVATYIPMVFGLRKKILQSGEVIALEPGVVYRKEVEAGHFYYEVGKYPPLGHRPMLDLTIEDASDANIVGAYSIATLKDGTKSYEFMRRFEIDKVRETSQTGATKKRNGESRQPSGPWVDWFPEQCKKTVVRRHSKTLPMSTDIIIEREGRELENAASVAALLSRIDEDEPTLITDDSGDTIDTSTGEVVEEGGDQTQGSGDDQPEATTTAAARGSPKPKAEPKAAAGKKAEPEKAEDPNPPAPAAEEEPAATDELGVTEHPAAGAADEILGKFAKAETIVDLEKLYGAHELDLAAMPDEIYDVVMGGYNRHRVRLGANRVPTQQPEPAE